MVCDISTKIEPLVHVLKTLSANWVGVEDPTNQVTESFDFVVMQQIKKLISALRKHLWPPNLVECWIRLRRPHQPSRNP